MPKLTRQFHLEITVEQFLSACSYMELQEINMRIDAHLRRHEQASRNLDQINKGIEHSKKLSGDEG